MKYFILLFLAGCTPYVGYSHISDPSISGDGSDIVCGGAKIEQGIEVSAAWCENLRNDWSGLKIDVEYVWD